jgi:hypothetical protein
MPPTTAQAKQLMEENRENTQESNGTTTTDHKNIPCLAVARRHLFPMVTASLRIPLNGTFWIHHTGFKNSAQLVQLCNAFLFQHAQQTPGKQQHTRATRNVLDANEAIAKVHEAAPHVRELSVGEVTRRLAASWSPRSNALLAFPK